MALEDAGFNPRPVYKPGDTTVDQVAAIPTAVSIHARFISRAILMKFCFIKGISIVSIHARFISRAIRN